jgi:non-haem Fe2+, alpha-ketoglutarate-dependent halogenase
VASSNAFPELKRDLRFHPLGVPNPGVLTTEQIGQYNEQGYLLPFSVFSQPEIAGLRQYFDDLLARAMAAGWGNYDITNWHKYCRGVWDVVTDTRILDIVQDLLGETIILRHSHLFAKLPGDGKQVSWHQDASYWPLSKSKVVSVWLALNDVDEGNAAMQVIPGSHRAAQIDFEDSKPEERNVLNQRVPNPGDYGEPVSLNLKAGQISLHSDWILHSSGVNTSVRPRCGLAMRFLSSDVRAYNGWNEHSIVCRGTEPTGHWANHPRPESEVMPPVPA